MFGLLVYGTRKLQQLSPPKPFRTYPDLVALLTERGMGIANTAHSERKIALVGYHRLSGYWFPARNVVRDLQQNVVLCDHFMLVTLCALITQRHLLCHSAADQWPIGRGDGRRQLSHNLQCLPHLVNVHVDVLQGCRDASMA